MTLQLKIEDNQSKFFLDLISNLHNIVKSVTIVDDGVLIKSKPENGYFEITGLDGTEYKVPNWSDEEFKEFGLRALYEENDNTEVEFE